MRVRWRAVVRAGGNWSWGRGFGVLLAEAAEEGHGVLRWVGEATTGG